MGRTSNRLLRPTALVLGCTSVGSLGLHAAFWTGLALAATSHVTMTPAAQDFGSVIVGSAGAESAVTVRNDGLRVSGALTLIMTGRDAGEFRIVADTCAGEVLGAGESCAVIVRFAPTSEGAKAVTLGVAAGDGRAASASLVGNGAANVVAELELPLFKGVEIATASEPEPDPGTVPQPSGGDKLARLDTGTAGRGGDLAVDQPARNMSDVDERMRLSPDQTTNHLDHDQVQRLDVARRRASWEDRRSTTSPMELTFVASGKGRVEERRPLAASEPSRGARVAPRAATPGSASLGQAQTAGDVDASKPQPSEGGDRLGVAARSPGLGVRDGRSGADHRVTSPVASARPDVARAPVAVQANERDRPVDDVDTQQITNAVASLVHASTAGGADGQGRGGTGGGATPGAGATEGSGSRSHALGVGDGDTFDIYTSDPRLMAYFRRIKAKIDPLWANAFPKSAMLELKQGMVILEFTVSGGGGVGNVAVLRPSGIEEFDRNCVDAVRRAGPFPPIPAGLGRAYLRIRAPFVATNPIIK